MINHILDQLKSGLKRNLKELDPKDRVIMNKFNQDMLSLVDDKELTTEQKKNKAKELTSKIMESYATKGSK